MDKKEKALGKIRKLLALAEDPAASEGEIENALKFAQTLMSKYDLDTQDIEINISDITVEEQDYTPKNQERKYWLWDLLNVIAGSQNCQTLKRKRFTKDRKNLEEYFAVYGTVLEVKIVREIFKVTVPVIRNLANKKHREKSDKVIQEQLLFGLPINPPNKSKFFNDYVDGFLNGLHIKLTTNRQKDIADDETGKYSLILVKKEDLVKFKIQETVKKVKTVKSSKEREIDAATWLEGQKDGKAEHNRLLEKG